MKKDEIIQCIREAFKDVSREDGVSLHEGYVMDAYGSEQERLEARRLDTETHWSQIDDRNLLKNQSSLSFFDRKSFKYYAPAFMMFALNNYQVSDAGCIDGIIYSFNLHKEDFDDKFRLDLDYEKLNEDHLERFRSFNEVQCTAIAKFLKFCEENPVHLDSDVAKKALENYWDKYL